MLALPLIFQLMVWMVVPFYAVFVPYNLRQRSKAVTEAGPLLLKAVRPRVRRWSIAFWAAASICWLMLSGMLLLGWGLSEPVDGSQLWILAFITVAFLSEALLRARGVRHDYLEIREAGILQQGIVLLPWDTVRDHRWLDKPDPTLQIRCANGVLQWRIARQQKEEVDALFRQHVPSAESSGPASG